MIRFAMLLASCLLFMEVQAQTQGLRPGDIIFQKSVSAQNLALKKATNSTYSHMGIVCAFGGKQYVYEVAYTVKLTLAAEWFDQGEDKHFVVKRLKNADEVLTSDTLGTFAKAAAKYRGRPYDLALEWSDEKMYSSELVWKIYRDAFAVELAPTKKLGELNLTDPTVKETLSERYGDKIPLEEPVISPQAIFDSPLLLTVLEK